MKKVLFSLAFGLFACASIVSAQPRQVEKGQTIVGKGDIPATVAAKYEGGMFGFDKKEEGSIKFDDVNERLVFFGKDKKEQFAIPYDSMMMVYTGTKSVRSGAGTAVSVIPLPGAGLAGLIREKRHYLTIQFSDRDVEASGVANFKIQNDQMRESVVHALGAKAQLTQRGDAYYRPRPKPKTEL
ncbi:MAG: hypothetical protein LH472_13505 [Pyrinomonadaceae bacterium]|nr:hypothetical protein [Pyrinomonadaceae bacterium]